MAHPNILGLNKHIQYSALPDGHHQKNNMWGVATLWLPETSSATMTIRFQDGPIQEHGVNGVGLENVLEVCRVRLQMFQEGPFRCRENALALTKIEEALLWLGARTALRQEQGVEGTNQTHKS